MRLGSTWHAAATFALLSTMVPPVDATPMFEYGDLSVTATRYLFDNLVEQDNDLAPAGNPALASVLGGPIGFAPFPTSPSALPYGFSSATMTGTGFGGVGVSFVSGGRPDHTAMARWTQDITNIGDESGSLDAHFDIPRLEASLFGGPPYGPFPRGQTPLAFAEVTLAATVLAQGGTERLHRTIFDYLVAVERRFQGDLCPDIHDVTISDDLRARVPGGPRVIQRGDVCGLEYSPFSGTVTLPTLASGERVVLDYVLTAGNLAWRSQTPELGYQAFAGDPFDVNGGGGIRITPSLPPSPLPEPPVALLLVSGFASLAGYRMRARS